MALISCPRCAHPHPIVFEGEDLTHQCQVCGQLFRAPPPAEPAQQLIPRIVVTPARISSPPDSKSPGPQRGGIARWFLQGAAISAGVVTVLIVAVVGLNWYSRVTTPDPLQENALDLAARDAATRAAANLGYRDVATVYGRTWVYPDVRIRLTVREGGRLRSMDVYMRHGIFRNESHFDVQLIKLDDVTIYSSPN